MDRKGNVRLAQNEFNRLVDIMARLRAPDGCPWDVEQTHESLRQYLLEETYEVLESIDHKNYQELKKELGDLLLQVIFHAQIASENKLFDISNVIQEINEKLIRRHPHVFSTANIRTAAEQTINWEKVKKKEGKRSVIDGVPLELPALARAARIQQKAATVGFDWENALQVWKKVDEELQELKGALALEQHEHISDEFGDLLFSLVNLARFINVNPEDALRNTIKKFSSRFKQLEQILHSRGKELADCSLQEMDAAWDEIKASEKKS